MTQTTPPAIVSRYLAAADARDLETAAACFTADGTVLDEGHTYRGRAEILKWRENLGAKFTYTTTVTRSEAVSDTQFTVQALVEGDFPGGTAHLNYAFTLQDALIADLRIVE